MIIRRILFLLLIFSCLDFQQPSKLAAAVAKATVSDTVSEQEPEADTVAEDDAPDLSKVNEFKELKAAFDKLQEQEKAKLRNATPKERFKLMKEKTSLTPFREKVMEMIDVDPASKDALEMLSWWSENSFRLGYSGLFDRLVEHHPESDLLGGHVPRMPRLMKREKAITTLRAITKKSPDDQTRGAAAFELYKLLLESESGDEVKAELAELRKALKDEYAEVKVRRGVTIGKHMEKLDFAAKLAIGQPVPEIEGSDLDGVEFKLSDYQGKVIVLSFWGDW